MFRLKDSPYTKDSKDLFYTKNDELANSTGLIKLRVGSEAA
jgi:hypothetical protein